MLMSSYLILRIFVKGGVMTEELCVLDELKQKHRKKDLQIHTEIYGRYNMGFYQGYNQAVEDVREELNTGEVEIQSCPISGEKSLVRVAGSVEG